jgi:hypothetical protein
MARRPALPSSMLNTQRSLPASKHSKPITRQRAGGGGWFGFEWRWFGTRNLALIYTAGCAQPAGHPAARPHYRGWLYRAGQLLPVDVTGFRRCGAGRGGQRQGQEAAAHGYLDTAQDYEQAGEGHFWPSAIKTVAGVASLALAV